MKRETNVSLMSILCMVAIVGLLSAIILFTTQENFKLQKALITCEQKQ